MFNLGSLIKKKLKYILLWNIVRVETSETY
jgi:hypothetical protein